MVDDRLGEQLRVLSQGGEDRPPQQSGRVAFQNLVTGVRNPAGGTEPSCSKGTHPWGTTASTRKCDADACSEASTGRRPADNRTRGSPLEAGRCDASSP